MRTIFFILFTIFTAVSDAQTIKAAGAEMDDNRVKEATELLTNYLKIFLDKRTPDYTKYWVAEDCLRSKLPDDMAYSIADSYSTYCFGDSKPTIFFARSFGDYVQLKTVFSATDSGANVQIWALTNHYVLYSKDGVPPHLISEISLHSDLYRTRRKRNITYHFPASEHFNKAASKKMIGRLIKIENQWGFKQKEIDYFYAPTSDALARMRGMDYNYSMDDIHPSGISYPEFNKLFCQGVGEGYLHEVLHIYFNPVYGKSPMCHAMIYYLAGGLGKDFNWFIDRMNDYLTKYPNTNLSQYETIISKDKFLHIDYVTKGLLCKMLDEKYGFPGLKRAFQYATVDELISEEFGIEKEGINTFLIQSFKKYRS